ncbi:MAG: hypothetical protein JW932_11255 [Deltaproteobacteria bacterium]|nr:hypothetical protein [Deltaproteobacteria bacterium]
MLVQDRFSGVRGSLFKSATICQEVMGRPFDKLMALSQVEGHRNIAYITAAPKSMVA